MRVLDRRVAAFRSGACTEALYRESEGAYPRAPPGKPFRALGSQPSLPRLQQRQVRGQAGEQVWRARGGLTPGAIAI